MPVSIQTYSQHIAYCCPRANWAHLSSHLGRPSYGDQTRNVCVCVCVAVSGMRWLVVFWCTARAAAMRNGAKIVYVLAVRFVCFGVVCCSLGIIYEDELYVCVCVRFCVCTTHMGVGCITRVMEFCITNSQWLLLTFNELRVLSHNEIIFKLQKFVWIHFQRDVINSCCSIPILK